MKKILITGANGFIGKSLKEGLESEYEIIPITKPKEITPTPKSITEINLLNSNHVDIMFDFFKDIEYVVHCATVGGRTNIFESPDIFSDNVKMYLNIMKHSNKFNKVILFGSGAEYSNNNRFSGLPFSFYGLSKKYISQHSEQFYLGRSITMRIWGCFGKYETKDRFITSNILRYINHEPMLLNTLFGHMDFFYIDDLVTIFKGIFQLKSPQSVYNCTYNKRDIFHITNMYQILEIINSLGNYKVDIRTEGPSDQLTPYINTEDNGLFSNNIQLNRSVELLGLRKGIKELYDYYLNNNNGNF